MASSYNDRKAIPYCIQPAMALAALCCLLFLGPRLAVCDEPLKGSEYEVKLGFIYNFINFTSWPDAALKNSPDTLTMCFASKDPSSAALYKLDGKSIRGRKIKVIAFEADTCLEQSHILFFATQDIVFIKQVLELTKGRNILTIGEVEGFTRIGGIINFFEEGNKLRFKINMDATRRSGLKMSSQLLGSAQIVKEDKK